MANILTADVEIYGKPENRKALIQELSEKHNIDLEVINEDCEFTEAVGEFRWNLDILMSKPVVDLIRKHHTALRADGKETGIGFYEVLGVTREGTIHHDFLDLPSVYFDYQNDN